MKILEKTAQFARGLGSLGFRSLSMPKGARLHLGCGNDYWNGYINIDIDPTAKCDIRADLRDVGRLFHEMTISEIVLIHSLNYLRLWEARDAFDDFHKLLVKHGRLVIETPDLVKCCRAVIRSESNLTDYLEGVRGIFAFDLDQVANRTQYMPYAFGWSSWHLVDELKKAGFGKIGVLNPKTHGKRNWRDTRIIATK